MRKTLVHVLLGVTLLSGCGKKRSYFDRSSEDLASAMVSGSGSASVATGVAVADPTAQGEGYEDWGKNPWVDASKDRLSTFSADVDTASYTLARRKLTEGQMPVPAGVRVEEFV